MTGTKLKAWGIQTSSVPPSFTIPPTHTHTLNTAAASGTAPWNHSPWRIAWRKGSLSSIIYMLIKLESDHQRVFWGSVSLIIPHPPTLRNATRGSPIKFLVKWTVRPFETGLIELNHVLFLRTHGECSSLHPVAGMPVPLLSCSFAFIERMLSFQ